MKRKINYFLVSLTIFSIIIGSMIGIYVAKFETAKLKKSTYDAKKLSIEEQEEKHTILVPLQDTKQYEKGEVKEEYRGYPVCARLEIPSISLDISILKEYSKKALAKSATKFWGAEPNQKGNFCVAGHNTKNVFYDIKNLEIGDTLFISDKTVGKVEYEVFKIEKVEPKEVRVLDPVTTGEKEVTLITCTNDGTKRVIIKAKEK